MARVLIVGRRKKSYRASNNLKHDTYLWSDGPLHESRTKNLRGWIESPFSDNEPNLTALVVDKLNSFKPQYVVAATESSVNLAALVRKELSLPGTSLEVANLLHNKYEMKKKAQSVDIPITDFHLITEDDTPDQLIAKLGLPLVMKPVAESGARGVVVLKDKAAVQKHLQPGLLAEAFVDGTEVSVETLIQQGEPIFHNITTYLHQWKKSILPAQMEKELEQEIVAVNDKVIKSFGVETGMTHSEFYLTKNGPLFGEMAIRPPGGYYMDLIEEAYGFDPWEAYVQIECHGRMPTINQTARKFAGVYAIHPGAGRVSRISGVDLARAVKENFEFKFRLNTGDVVTEPEATSNEVGHVLMSSPDPQRLIDQMNFIEDTIKIDLA